MGKRGRQFAQRGDARDVSQFAVDAPFFGFGAFALGDVEDDAHVAVSFSGLGDGAAPGEDPAFCAAWETEADFTFEGQFVQMGAADFRDHSRLVIGMNASKDVCKFDCFVGAKTQDVAHRPVEPDGAAMTVAIAVSVQIARPETQFTCAGGEFYELLAAQEGLLGAATSAALHDQGDDRRGLQDEDRQCDEYPFSVSFPRGGLPEIDGASGREALLADFPSAKLAPIVARAHRTDDPGRKI